MDVRLKRVYEPAAETDGYRVLIDRLWPRGVSRERARLDAVERELAPSTELRRWFGHDPARFDEFRRRYIEELRMQRSAPRAPAALGAREHAHPGLLGPRRGAQRCCRARRSPAARIAASTRPGGSTAMSKNQAPPERRGIVVLGVDGSAGAADALRWALEGLACADPGCGPFTPGGSASLARRSATASSAEPPDSLAGFGNVDVSDLRGAAERLLEEATSELTAAADEVEIGRWSSRILPRRSSSRL